MNQHLNVFRPYGDTDKPNLIENNLSRAFAICLTHDKVFFWKYLEQIISAEDLRYLRDGQETDDIPLIDIQKNMSGVETEGVRRVYAVAMTTENLDMTDFPHQQVYENRTRHLADIWIQVKDIVVVIEVKKNATDCKGQLFNQVLAFRENENDIVPISFCWPDAVGLMDEMRGMTDRCRPLFLLNDLSGVIESGFWSWFPSRPLSNLEFNLSPASRQREQLHKRLREIMHASNYDIIESDDRVTFSVDFGWANEIKPAFETHNDRNYLALTIWPGNTKAQGWSLYHGNLDWTTQDSLDIRGRNYPLITTFYIKFCHFSAFVSGFNFTSDDLLDPDRPIHTLNNYDLRSGLWRRGEWVELEAFFDDHLKSELSWRRRAQWETLFDLKPGRTELTVSFGWQVTLRVPFEEIAALDTTLDNPGPAAAFLDHLVEGMRQLIEQD